eukprot:COSAG05_NODE_2192_length_3419_cov_2.728916_1_plen_498_part_00
MPAPRLGCGPGPILGSVAPMLRRWQLRLCILGSLVWGATSVVELYLDEVGSSSWASHDANQTVCTKSHCPSNLEVCVAVQQGGIAIANCASRRAWPMQAADLRTVTALFFGLSLASAGGVGGGALVVPILILLEGVEATATVPFAQLCGFATALPRFAMTSRRRHPKDPARPLIDFETFLILTPATLIGNLLGVHLNVTSPDNILLGVMVVLLSYITVRTFRRGLSMWKRDMAASSQPALLPSAQLVTSRALIDPTRLLDPTRASPFAQPETSAVAGGTGFNSYRSQCGTTVPCASVASVAILFGVISTLSYLRGSPARPSPVGVQLCSLRFWALDAGSLAALCLHLVIGVLSTRQRHAVRAAVHAQHLRRSYESDLLRIQGIGSGSSTPTSAVTAIEEGEVSWLGWAVARYCGCATLAGFASAYIGIGGESCVSLDPPACKTQCFVCVTFRGNCHRLPTARDAAAAAGGVGDSDPDHAVHVRLQCRAIFLARPIAL